MIQLTATGGRFAVIAFSGAVHAAIFLTPLGHPGAPGRAKAEPMLVDVELQTAPAPLPEPDTPLENHATAFPTHTHPYPVPASHDWTPHDPNLVHVMAHENAASREETPPKVDTSTVLTADATETMPRFSLVVSSGTLTPGANGGAFASPAGGHDHDHGDGLSVLSEQAVDTPAHLTHGVTPSYPSDARADGVEAEVKLELVVSASGAVENAKVVRKAGHGLDEAAIGAARQFRFSPAVKHGQAVRVRMSWAVEFRLD